MALRHTSLSKDISFDRLKLINAVKKIKSKCKLSCDPDGYPLIFLLNLIPVLSDPLSMLYNSLISIGKIPSSWKRAFVTPIYKKGLASSPANYRPISQTSIFCKLVERVTSHDLADHLMQQGLLSKKQHGFIKGRSTLTNLIESVSDWPLALDNKRIGSVIYIDFARAFDTVSHPKLLLKLQAYGITGNLLKFVSDFLDNRSQKTRVGRSLSDAKHLMSGVIQGSCLGPLLFLLYVNDVVNIFDNAVEAKLYADDIKLYSCIETVTYEFRLQHNLNMLVDWAEEWQLSISISKCSILHLSARKKKSTPATYFINRSQLNDLTYVNDLGVTIDEHLSFSKHINNIARKADARCSLIMKCFQSKRFDCLVKAYVTYVRPLLEYNSPVWSPHCAKDIRTLERVQKRFSKKLPALHDLSYHDRLDRLGLERLEARRIRADLVLTYKIISGLSELALSDFFTLSNVTQTNR